MIKKLFILAIMLTGCENSPKSSITEAPPEYMVAQDYANVTPTIQVTVLEDSKRNVTCWVAYNTWSSQAPSIWCMKNDLATKK